jgi:hypothetical protein
MESRDATQFLHTVKQIKVYSYLSGFIFIIIYYFYFHRKTENIYNPIEGQGLWRGSRRRDQTRRNVIFKQHTGQHQVHHQYVSGITKFMGSGGLYRQTESRRATASVVDMRVI